MQGLGHAYVVVPGGKLQNECGLIFVGAMKWDSCAGHALLKALGGQIIDLSSQEIIYPNDKSKALNKKGSIAYLKSDPRYTKLAIF